MWSAKEAFILDLRQRVLAIEPPAVQRDRLLAEQEQLLTNRQRFDEALRELERRILSDRDRAPEVVSCSIQGHQIYSL